MCIYFRLKELLVGDCSVAVNLASEHWRFFLAFAGETSGTVREFQVCYRSGKTWLNTCCPRNLAKFHAKNTCNFHVFFFAYGCFQKIGIPQNGWFIMENPMKMGWFGGTTIFGNTIWDDIFGAYDRSLGRCLTEAWVGCDGSMAEQQACGSGVPKGGGTGEG